MRIFLVGGTWDDNGGKKSSLIANVSSEIKSFGDHSVLTFNGGNFYELDEILDKGGEWADIICWFPNVPNDKEKIRNVKERFPKKMLVISKRNNNEYSFMELANKALGAKANLVLEFTKQDSGLYAGRVFDPLGAIWCDYTTDFEKVVKGLMSRLEYLISVTRIPSKQIDPKSLLVPDNDELYELIKGYADDFHRLMMPEEGVSRFLGNASFRCIKSGFPSFRGEDGIVFVSRRNVDKRYIGPEAFVATRLDEHGNVEYWGENKPSVDTPIQLRLYDMLPNVNFMLHAHVYVDKAPYSNYPVPCGAIEEVDKIMGLIDANDTDFSINLLGHGSIVFASSIEYLKNIPYIGRNIPELI